jgi:hypothetical protein
MIPVSKFVMLSILSIVAVHEGCRKQL